MDIWKHGKYIDLWSLVHLTTAILGATILFKLELNLIYIFFITFLFACAWELAEKLINIAENNENIFMDILTALLGALLVYLFQDFFVTHEVFAVIAILTAAISLWGFIDFRKRGYR